MAREKRDIGLQNALWRSMRRRLRLECRECEIICERVVSPWQCLRNSCPYVYVYEETETTYFGCLHKVFTPELDLSAFHAAAEKGGRPADPYGSIRAMRSPQPQCHVRVEQAYAALATPGCCCNPTFFLHPDLSDEGIRLTANPRLDPAEDPTEQ